MTPTDETSTIPLYTKLCLPRPRLGYTTSRQMRKVEGNRQVTVMLNGQSFSATMSVNLWAAQSAAAEPTDATLPDGNYMATNQLSNLTRSRTLTLYAISAGNDVGIALTLTHKVAYRNPKEVPVSGTRARSSLTYSSHSEHQTSYLAEPGNVWMPYSTCDAPSKSSAKTSRRSTGHVIVPANTVLTLRGLVKAFHKMPTHQIEDAVQELIDLIDNRGGDADFEVDADLEADIDEESDQIV